MNTPASTGLRRAQANRPTIASPTAIRSQLIVPLSISPGARAKMAASQGLGPVVNAELHQPIVPELGLAERWVLPGGQHRPRVPRRIAQDNQPVHELGV